MPPVLSSHSEQRILLRTMTARDATLTAGLLQRAGIDSVECKSAAQMVAETRIGAGALLIAEEVLGEAEMPDLVELLRKQPPWSDLPVLIVASPGAVSTTIIEAMDVLANVTVVERPLRIFTLITAVRSALRARERQYQLRSLLDGLHQADQRKTEFLATLAHELRNPLAPISTALSILLIESRQDDAARRHFEMMRRQVQHMVRLIDDLMEVSRITRGKIELKMEVLALDRVIQDAIELSRPALEASAHRLHVAIEADDWRVLGDRVRLTQVFSNLLNNAAKYTPAGGRIEIRAARGPACARVSVCDNGVGIPAGMLEAIFDMFVQVNDTSRTAQGGLGIGLTLVRSLVELHGGSIQAASAGIGQGTEFRVELPLLHGVPAQAAAAPAQAPTAPLAENVLIVDDNSDAADSLAALLRVLGARTLVAYDARTALVMAAAHPLSVAILDIGMPGMDGCELARRMRSDPRHAELLLVALTGWGQAEDRARVAAAGFDHHFLKPLDTTALIAALQARQHGARAGAQAPAPP